MNHFKSVISRARLFLGLLGMGKLSHSTRSFVSVTNLNERQPESPGKSLRITFVVSGDSVFSLSLSWLRVRLTRQGDLMKLCSLEGSQWFKCVPGIPATNWIVSWLSPPPNVIKSRNCFRFEIKNKFQLIPVDWGEPKSLSEIKILLSHEIKVDCLVTLAWSIGFVI